MRFVTLALLFSVTATPVLSAPTPRQQSRPHRKRSAPPTPYLQYASLIAAFKAAPPQPHVLPTELSGPSRPTREQMPSEISLAQAKDALYTARNRVANDASVRPAQRLTALKPLLTQIRGGAERDDTLT
ncbi:MAG: hypothetical protein M1829_005452 [Trizodia sp. TS-e1964]|nr:MAG: hypothetical protein M1829_005452 [Trizodia sp. TS-e1964]